MIELLEQAIQWNNPDKNKDNIPLLTSVCTDHPAVSQTSYTEINQLLGTSGCSRTDPWWNWIVLGVIRMDNGVIIVCPGDWIIEVCKDQYVVINDKVYRNLLYSDLSKNK